MPELKELLVEELQDLLNAENQLIGSLPKFAEAARNNRLKTAFQKHLAQTEVHAERLKIALQMLGKSTGSKPCLGMKGLLEEGQEKLDAAAGNEDDSLGSDLALVGAAQKVEHYEISGYGTARCLARQLNEPKIAKLLSLTLGEEESTDFLLTELSKPLLEQMVSAEMGNGTRAPWGEIGETGSAGGPPMGRDIRENESDARDSRQPERQSAKVRAAAVGGLTALKTKKKS